MEGFLVLGFLIGMSHALEADHLAAIATMAAKNRSRRNLTIRGATWGLGHSVMLFGVCAVVIFVGLAINEELSSLLECCVGLMLVLLGIEVLFKMWKQRVHFHLHSHGEGKFHFHAHSHAGDSGSHLKSHHSHDHPSGSNLRAFIIGLVHGAAGSAGLLALTVSATGNPWLAMGYILLFSMGSIIGMATLSLVAAWPLSWAEHSMKYMGKTIRLGTATVAIWIGSSIIFTTGPLAIKAL